MDIRTLGIRPGSIIEMTHPATGEKAKARIMTISNSPDFVKVEWLRHEWVQNAEGRVETHTVYDWSEEWKLCEAESVSGILERYENPEVPQSPEKLKTERRYEQPQTT